MKKSYQKLVLASAIAAILAGCGGETAEEDKGADGKTYQDRVTEALDPEKTLEGDEKEYRIQDVAYLFGEIFKDLFGAIEMMTNTTTNLTNEESAMGRLVGSALTGQAQSSGISITSTADCSKSGKFEIAAHFEDETGNTPAGSQEDPNVPSGDFLASFANYEVETAIRLNFGSEKDPNADGFGPCEEYGRDPDGDASSPDVPADRIDTATDQTIEGSMEIGFVSYPNQAKTGFSLTASVDMGNFMTSYENATANNQPIRFDGNISASLSTSDVNVEATEQNPAPLQFAANIGANFADTNAENFSYIDLTADGILYTNADFDTYRYNLDVQGATTNRIDGVNKTFEFIATETLVKNVAAGDFDPDTGELMIITPEGDYGFAEVKNNGDIEISYDGQTITCSFQELLDGSDACGKPQ